MMFDSVNQAIILAGETALRTEALRLAVMFTDDRSTPKIIRAAEHYLAFLQGIKETE